MKCRITIDLEIPDTSSYISDYGKLFVEKIIKGYCYLASLILQRDMKNDDSVLLNRTIINSINIVETKSLEDEDTKFL